ncbi:DUF2950 domain-containing protein [Ancylobacter oerskovii]|uniref:DUF2950 domain-containing protein n=1 Tax=Ancylobacter oerskovii TaxID=459519 RepID=A0ABW4YZM3_9HYPH|nr:DUF2950 domain-containing protein [Ancylobacter oerskovii]MBS7543968.1 DUF2950 domain-containing protein [Ancylobacter oerskovii]
MLNALRRGTISAAAAFVVAVGAASLGTPAALAQAPADVAARQPSPGFGDPAQAVEALKAALAGNDFDGVARLLGLDAGKLRASDGVMDTFDKIRQGAAERLEVEDVAADRKILDIGRELWPLPFPLVKNAEGKWAFDTAAGLDEIENRRIGENEIEAIATLRAYVDAQRTYATADHDGDGVLEFARKLISSPGQTDGLYWPPEQGDGDSPAGPAIDAGSLEKAKQGKGYFGYRFRILQGQGDRVAGGRYDYVINGNMIAGFGLIAWPVAYGETGVHSFVVNQAGIVYEKDLGPDTAARVEKIRRFDPDKSWEIVKD